MRASTSAVAAARMRPTRTPRTLFLLGIGVALGLSLTAAPAHAGPITDSVKKVTSKVDSVTTSTTKKVTGTTKKVTKKVTKKATTTVRPVTRTPLRSTTSVARNAAGRTAAGDNPDAPLAPVRRALGPARASAPLDPAVAAKTAKKAVRVVRVATRDLAKPVIFGTPALLDPVVDLLPDELPIVGALPDVAPIIPGTPPLLPDPGLPVAPAGPGAVVSIAAPPASDPRLGAARADAAPGPGARPPRLAGTEDLRPDSSLTTTIAFLLTGRPGTDLGSTSTYSWAAYVVVTGVAVAGLSLGATGVASSFTPVFAGVALCDSGARPGRTWRMPRVTRAGPTPAGTTSPEPGFSPD